MTITDVGALVDRFLQSREDDKNVRAAGAQERREIVLELLRRMPALEVSQRLGISVQRVNQIKRGIRTT